MTKSFLVVGAGISGLATAAALQQRGYEVSVIEERTDTSAGAAISIWPNALAALDALGLGDDVRDAGGRITAGSVRWHDGRWLRRPDVDRLTRALGEPLVVLARADLMEILTSAVTPGTIQLGVAAREVSMDRDGVHVVCSDGATREAEALIGADGTRSAVARWLNGPLTDRYSGYTAWRGLANVGMDADLAGETLGPGAEVGHVPLGPDRTYWFATERMPEGRQNEDELAYLRSRLASWPDPIPALVAATHPSDLIRTDIHDRQGAKVWARDRALIIGDAAHPMRPHLGQGGCQGLEDAAMLGSLLRDGSDVAGAFARFVVVRRGRVTPIVRESRRIGQVMNVRPDWLGASAARASALVPEALLTRHLAGIASRDAFRPA